MSVPFKSLDAVTGPGAGLTHDLEDTKHNHALHAIVTGSPTTWSVSLQGSLDGTNWVTMNATGNSDPDHYNFTSSPFRYIRANCSQLDGGTDPTLTVWVASA